MRAKHPEMASDKAKMGLKWGVLAPESTRIIENEPLRQQRSCARWVFPQPARIPEPHPNAATSVDRLPKEGLQNPA